jgi:hypothetical protein
MNTPLIIALLLVILVLTGLIGRGLWRWRRGGYRFRLQTLLLVTALASVMCVFTVEFLLPIAQRRWAFDAVKQPRGSFFYRVDVTDGNPQFSYVRDPSDELQAVHFKNDQAAISASKALKWLPDLVHVEFGEGVTDRGIKAVLVGQPMTAITSLSFQCPHMSDEALSSIGRLSTLESLMFTSSGITDKSLENLREMEGLKTLHIWEILAREKGPRDRQRFGLEGYAAIGQLKSLTFLRIRGLAIDDESCRALHSLVNLKDLSLVYCIISDAALADLRKGLPDCNVTIHECVGPNEPKPDWY